MGLARLERARARIEMTNQGVQSRATVWYASTAVIPLPQIWALGKGGKRNKEILQESTWMQHWHLLSYLRPFFFPTDYCWSVISALSKQFQLVPCALWQELRRVSLNTFPWSLPIFLLSPQMGQGALLSAACRPQGLPIGMFFSLL